MFRKYRELRDELNTLSGYVKRLFARNDQRLEHLIDKLGFYGFWDDGNIKDWPDAHLRNPLKPERDFTEKQPVSKRDLKLAVRQLEDKLQALCDHFKVDIKSHYEVHPPVPAPENPYVIVKRKKKAIGG